MPKYSSQPRCSARTLDVPKLLSRAPWALAVRRKLPLSVLNSVCYHYLRIELNARFTLLLEMSTVKRIGGEKTWIWHFTARSPEFHCQSPDDVSSLSSSNCNLSKEAVLVAHPASVLYGTVSDALMENFCLSASSS